MTGRRPFSVLRHRRRPAPMPAQPHRRAHLALVGKGLTFDRDTSYLHRWRRGWVRYHEAKQLREGERRAAS